MADIASRPTDAAARLDGIVMLALGAEQVALKDDVGALDEHLASLDKDFLGFGVEGAAMGLTVLDHRDPRDPRRIDQLLAGRWRDFPLLAYAGAGLGLAELGEPVLPWVQARHDIAAGFAIDGYAFHLALLAPSEFLDGRPPPAEFQGPAARAFDHGLARTMWFTSAAEPSAVAAVVERFPDERRDDVWSGVGVAATYAGGLDATGLGVLRTAARHHAPALAAGSALASYLRVQGDNVVPGNQTASEALTGRSTADAHSVCARCRTEAEGGDVSLDAFVRWRDALCAAFADRS